MRRWEFLEKNSILENGFPAPRAVVVFAILKRYY